MAPSNPELFTIGHSNHRFDAFVELLRRHSIELVADVRSVPYSRWLPHFRQSLLETGLADAGISYLLLGNELGARREEPEAYEAGVASYGRIAKLPAFQAGLSRLREAARTSRVAMMCSEKEPLDCHRTILVSRFLRDEFHIHHILADGRLEPHAEAEERLLRKMRIGPSLLEPTASQRDLVQQAYEARGREIAYRDKSEK